MTVFTLFDAGKVDRDGNSPCIVPSPVSLLPNRELSGNKIRLPSVYSVYLVTASFKLEPLEIYATIKHFTDLDVNGLHLATDGARGEREYL